MRTLIILSLLVAVGCGDDDMMTPDTGVDDAGVDDADVDAYVEPVEPLPVDPDFDEDYAGEPTLVVTTLRETYQPRYGYHLYVERGMSRVPPNEFGRLHPQPGEPHTLRDQLPLGASVSWTPGALPEAARSVHYAFVFGDPQYVDQDSPALMPKNNAGGLPAYRPWAEMAPHLGDALMRNVRAFHERRPLDYVYVVGDAIENAQQNELEWFTTFMNGGVMSTDSGERNDVVPGPNNDPYDPIVMAGVPSGVPWLNVAGNHDILVNGNFPPGLIVDVNGDDEALEALAPLLSLVGLTLPGVGTGTLHRGWLPPEQRAIFTVDPDAFDLDLLPYRRSALARLPETEVVADASREFLDVCTYMAAFVGPSGPSAEDITRCEAIRDQDPTSPAGGWYTVDAGPALCVLALALGPVEGGAEGILARPFVGCMVGGEPCHGDPRYDQIAFIEAELARAAEDEVALLVVSHQASEDLVVEPALAMFRSFIESSPVLVDIWERWVPTPNEPVTTTAFRTLLAESGVVIAHLAGHNHRHQVRAICGDGSAREATQGRCAGAPGSGYWEITTSGVIDFPHQGRFVEIVDVGEGLGALYLTALDPRVAPGSMTERARFVSRAWVAATRETGDYGRGLASDRNLLLPFVIPAGVAAKWAEADLADALASETVLTEPAGTAPMHPIWPD